MQKLGLKLKQASAVLQIQPKELQNLVQFGVVKPKRSEGTYLFDANTLLVAKFAFCLGAANAEAGRRSFWSRCPRWQETSAKSRMRKSCGQFAPTVRKDEHRRSPLPPKRKKRRPRGVVDTSVLV